MEATPKKYSTVIDEIPGGFKPSTSEFELNYWQNFGGAGNFDLHFKTYDRVFPISTTDYSQHRVLDIGSGPISVFEVVVPDTADVVPYDLLAAEYNSLAPNKKFQIVAQIDDSKRFSLISLFNMIDHVIRPDEVMVFAAGHLQEDGRVWLAVHLYRPHGIEGHPQNYSVSGIVDFVADHFRIERCGILREHVPHPYIWYGELSTRTAPQSRLELAYFKVRDSVHYYTMQALRIAVKGVKLVGGRNLLPEPWQF